MAASLVFGLALVFLTAIGFLIIPPLIVQVSDFIDAVPDFIDDLTAGRGPLGFLQDDYQLVDRIQEAIDRGGAAGVLGLSAGVIDVVRSVVTAVVGVITIIFLTFFMLLEGPKTVERVLGLLPEATRARYERVGDEIYRTISGYVTGNLLISVIAGVVSTIVLFAVGSDYAIALGLLVAILDLIPLAGATLAAIFVSTDRLHRDRPDPLPDRDRVLHRLPAAREPRSPAARVRDGRCSCRPLPCSAPCSIGAELAGILGAAARDPGRGVAARDRARAAALPAGVHHRGAAGRRHLARAPAGVAEKVETGPGRSRARSAHRSRMLG